MIYTMLECSSSQQAHGTTAICADCYHIQPFGKTLLSHDFVELAAMLGFDVSCCTCTLPLTTL